MESIALDTTGPGDRPSALPALAIYPDRRGDEPDGDEQAGDGEADDVQVERPDRVPDAVLEREPLADQAGDLNGADEQGDDDRQPGDRQIIVEAAPRPRQSV